MSICWSRRISLLFAASLLHGCVSLRAPLVQDKHFPHEWGELTGLGSDCSKLAGSYLNVGKTTAGDNTQSVSLMAVLGFPSDARTVALDTNTRKVDSNGDAFVTLRISADGDKTDIHEREGCFCIKQTLVCTQIDEKYWSLPGFGLGGSQSNAYFSRSADGSLIAKLQNYRADVVLGIPIFKMNEPWVRFEGAER